MIITRAYLKSLKFRVFTPMDYNGFDGVMSPVPLMAEDGDYVIVIDGNVCEVYGDEPDGGYGLIADCQDVMMLED